MTAARVPGDGPAGEPAPPGPGDGPAGEPAPPVRGDGHAGEPAPLAPQPIEYSSTASLRGPLMAVEGVRDIGWNEVAEIRLADGEVRHGVVLDIHLDYAIVEVLEGTAGMRLDGVRTAFGGGPMSVPVTEEWLGRVCDGRGEPLDGGPPILSGRRREIAGAPINPAVRLPPSEPIVTGVSAIDGLATLVRGQKLPIFSVGGLPHLELAAQIAVQAHVAGEPFAVVFAALGVTHADAASLRRTLQERAEEREAVLFINTAEDPVVERLMTPRLALTVAEHLAFECDRHVLVLLADVTNYAEALRQVSAARGEVPTRRGYPGYLYSDLASLFERAGRMRGHRGSVTLVPVLTMPAGDITHPVPDLTGYITEGQLVLSADLHTRGIYPPLDLMGSLSRLMRRGAGAQLTREDHLELSDQLYALTARALQAAELAEIVGADALPTADQRLLVFHAALERELLSQGRHEARTLQETLDRGWQVASCLPAAELTMVSRQTLAARYRPQELDPEPAAAHGDLKRLLHAAREPDAQEEPDAEPEEEPDAEPEEEPDAEPEEEPDAEHGHVG
jgi:V/A-type H+/Na+-transporting ATPase subunit B